jgi:hypothetical protein
MDLLPDIGPIGVVSEAEDAEKDELLEVTEGGSLRFKPHCGV